MHWETVDPTPAKPASFVETASYRALVVTATIAILMLYAPMVIFGWRGSAGFEIVLSPAGIVRQAGPHARASGVRVGDALDLGNMHLVQRLSLGLPSDGRRERVLLTRDGRRFEADVVAVHHAPPAGIRWPFAIAIALTCAFVVLGGFVALRRPGAMGVWFFVFTCGLLPAGGLLVYAGSPLWFEAALQTYRFFFVSGCFAYPLIPFMLRFPDGDVSGWRAAWRPWSAALLSVGVAGAAYRTVTSAHAGFPVVNPAWLELLANVPFVVAVLLLGLHLARGDATTRTRSTWASIGFAAIIASGASFAYLRPLDPMAGFIAYDVTTTVALVAFGVAILKHNVFDISFSINRALVFAVLTFILVGSIASIDWLVGRLLSRTSLAVVLEASVTIALGYALNALHARIERVVEAVLFRQRRDTERYMRRLSATLPFATSADAVSDALVHDAAREMRLASAALFTTNGEGYRRVACYGAFPEAFETLSEDDVIVRFLRHEGGPLRLAEVRRRASAGPQAIAVAVPLAVRHEVIGVALYGSHADGLAIDPEELELLATLASVAALSIEAIDARRTREELAALRRRYEIEAR